VNRIRLKDSPSSIVRTWVNPAKIEIEDFGLPEISELRGSWASAVKLRIVKRKNNARFTMKDRAFMSYRQSTFRA
jgi:hypothetical protein